MALLNTDDAAQSGIYDSYGIDWEGSVVTETEEHVTVPNTFSPLDDNALQQLKLLVNPTLECEDHGIMFYIATKEFIQNINL